MYDDGRKNGQSAEMHLDELLCDFGGRIDRKWSNGIVWKGQFCMVAFMYACHFGCYVLGEFFSKRESKICYNGEQNDKEGCKIHRRTL